MNTRNTAGKLGFIKDSEGVYRKGNFIFKNGKIIRESQIVPKGTLEDLKEDYITLDECIRSILAYSTTIGDVNPRATNVYIDKVGNNYKPAKSLSKNTVAVVMSNRQVMELKPREIIDQDSNELKPEEKPTEVKEIKDFSKPIEFDKMKKESTSKKVKEALDESQKLNEYGDDAYYEEQRNDSLRNELSEVKQEYKDKFREVYSLACGIGNILLWDSSAERKLQKIEEEVNKLKDISYRYK